MTVITANTVYTQGGGASSTTTFVDIFLDRAPTPNDINYQRQQKWYNTSTNDYWVLVGFTSTGGTVQANWQPITSSVSMQTLTGNSGGAVGPNGSNNINFVGDGTSINIVGNPGTNTLTASLVTPVTVSEGGTGRTSLTAYGLLAGGTTSTGNIQQVGVGLANQILTSNGPGFLPTFQSIVLPTESLAINVKVFTTPGANTYTPTAGLAYAIVEVVGGGGGGSSTSSTNSSTTSAGGGGGAGEYARGTFSSSAIGSSQTVTIGSGATGGSSTPGVTTSFGSLLTALGGGTGGTEGINAVSGSNGNLGGTGGTGGDFRSAGGSGGGGFGAVGTGGDGVVSGSGGASYFGSGGNSVGGNSTAISNGSAGVAYGSGGSGAITGTSQSGATGGTGASGICIVTEYIGGFTTTFTWTDGSGTFTANAQTGYFITATSNATLPASPTEGTTIAFIVDTSQILTITANTGQTIRISNTTTSSGGTAVNTFRGDSVNLVFRTSGSVWVSTATEGNWNLT